MGTAGQGPDRTPAAAGTSPIDDTHRRAYSAPRLNGTGADDPSTAYHDRLATVAASGAMPPGSIGR